MTTIDPHLIPTREDGHPSQLPVRGIAQITAVAWACAAWPVVRRRWVRVLLAVYPPAMLLSVLVTGNHWMLDAIVGAGLLAASYGVARAIDRLRVTRVAWFRSPEAATNFDLG